MKKLILLTIITFWSSSCKQKTSNTATKIETAIAEKQPLKIYPISHATMALESDNTVVYVDPVGGAEKFEDLPKPNLILITDIHGDHLNIDTLENLKLENTTLVVPNAVADRLPESMIENTIVLNNGSTNTVKNIKVTAIPMYNLREEALKFHSKGRGNGYVLTLGNNKIYISGDTEDIPEMRSLKDIDKAFVCMNLPYTMTVESAASAVLDFKPKQVYPYHYRGTNGLSDVSKFKRIVNAENKDIEVILLDWYSN